jgi:serine/threonine-protein kinase
MRIVLLDFGIARTPGLSSPMLPAEIATVPMGTPDFMPPEQATGHWDWVDARSDVYALGATMFTLLSGRYVRDGVSVRAQLDAARRDPAPSLSHIAPGLRAAVTEVVDRALAFDPEARYASARQMQHAVRDARASYVAGAERALATRRHPQSGMHLAVNPHAPTAHGRIARAS